MLREIRARLEEAADTLRRLPMPREYIGMKGGKTMTLHYIQNAMEAYGYTEATSPRLPPSAGAIDRLDEVLAWMRWLPERDAKLVWMRAMRIGWKRVAGEFNCDRTTAWRHYSAAIMVIAARRDSELRNAIAAA